MDHPWWGGWSGRFSREKVKNDWSRHASVRVDEENFDPFYTFAEGEDTWTDPVYGETYEGNFVPVWRWRRAFYNDFRCRMDWCTSSYQEANHHPVAAVNGDRSDKIIHFDAMPGGKITLDAAGTSDPDGDLYSIHWWYYPEAGTYSGSPEIEDRSAEKTVIEIPEDAAGSEIHFILEVKDMNDIASLYDYRRIVVSVNP
jgi:hypothetical protein